MARCVDSEEAFSFVEGQLLALIFAMLAIGAALEASGAVSLIVEALAPYLMNLPPWAIVWAIYLLTSVLTELVSNNAVAVVVTPIAIGLAQAMDSLGESVCLALREPSLGPCLGVKGGATGGGYSQVVPADRINLMFTGDFPAITTVNNLIAAAIDNYREKNQ